MLILHTFDEVDVRNIVTGVWVHGIVHEVLDRGVWVSIDKVFGDVLVDPSSDRIRMHESTVA